MESIAELRRICQADKLQRSRGLTRLNRFVSIYATFAALALGVSANVLTVASIAAGLAGAVLLALPDYLANLGGVTLLYVSFMLDQVDGEVARYHRCTVTGAYLDEVRHILIYAAPVFALSLQLFMARPSLVTAGAGFAAAIGLIILRFNANAHHLLLTKKILAGPDGERLLQKSPDRFVSREPRQKRSLLARRLLDGFGQAVDGINYLTTNQVSLLFLLLIHVHLLRFVPNRQVHELVFRIYAATVVLLTLLSVWKMAYWGRIEKRCADVHRALAKRGTISGASVR